MDIRYTYTSNTGSFNSSSNDDLSKSINQDDHISGRLDEIRRQKSQLLAEEGELIHKGLHSYDPDVLMKAHSAWHDVQEKSSITGKSILLDPNEWNDSQGYKRKPINITGTVLRRMARTPIIRAIISTRQTQISAFSKPQPNRYDTGFIIRKKKKFFSDEEIELTKADKKRIQELTEFILNCGSESSTWYGDNFDGFLRKLVEECYINDAGTFEVVRNKKGEPVKFFAVDGATIRIADTFDDDEDNSDSGRKEERGYYPSYVQVIDGTIRAEYYPWELCYGARNASSDINTNGYGRSELEDLVSVITWMLYGDAYNGNFFSQGASPKGMLKVSGNVNRNRLSQFRQQWMAMVAGVENAWKVPVIESDKMEWIDLQKSNTDMQFSKWQEYLIKIACAVFKISPEEIGFNLGNASGGGSLFESNNEARLKYSKDKGLRPLLKAIEFWINKWIINPLDDEYEFSFVGIDAETEEKEVELDIKKVSNFMGYKEIRRKYNLPDDIEEGDFILNPQYIQMIQAQQFAGESQESTEAVDEGGGDDIWDSLDQEDGDVEKSEITDIFMQDAIGMLYSDEKEK